MAPPILGIDIGGSGVKANLVDVASGALLSDRHKIPTPRPSVPTAVAEVVAEMVQHFGYEGPIGCTFPAIVRRGITMSAANVDPAWVGTNAEHLFEAATGLDVRVVNDADAAGIAEMTFGAGKEEAGLVVMLTFGTGIGSGMFIGRRLVPNTELGHLHYLGHAPVERWCSARVKDEEGLSWPEWALRVNDFLHHLDRVFSPDLFIIGGGVSRRFEKYSTYLDTPIPVVPAALENEAGIVGAAVLAAEAGSTRRADQATTKSENRSI